MDKKPDPSYFPPLDGTSRHEWREVSIEATELPDINKYCNENRVGKNEFFKALWSIILYHFADVDVIAFGANTINSNSGTGNTINGNLEEIMYVHKVSINSDTQVEDLFSSVNPISRHDKYPQFNTGLFFSHGYSDRNMTDFIQRSLTVVEEMNDQYKIILVIQNFDEYPSLLLRYNTSTLSFGNAKNLAGTIVQTVYSLMGKVVSVKDVDLISTDDREDILHSMNKSLLETKHNSVLDIILDQVFAQPTKLAVSSWDGELSYEKLDDLSTKVSQYITSLGVGHGDIVPICFEKSLWAVVATIAVMKSGAAFVPLDPALPVLRLENIIDQVKSHTILASPQQQNLLASVKGVVTISKKIVKHLPQLKNATLRSISRSQISHIIFTSGSTGNPKGCIIEHSAVLQMPAHAASVQIHHDSRVLQFASFGFAASLLEIFGTLAVGGTLVFISDHDRLNNLTNAICAKNVTWAMLTPALVHSMKPEAVRCLHTLALVGEPPSAHQISAWTSAVNVINVFGFSENTGPVCVASLNGQSNPRNIGFPPTDRLWLVEPGNHNKLAPIGAPAELLVDGYSLARGYLNNEEQTAKSFIESPPWSPEGGRVLYKSGDIVRYSDDGSLIYLGRKDLRVNIRGMRIETGEVEYHTRRAFNITQTIVEVVIPANNSDPILAAFLLTKKKNTNLETDLVDEPSESFRTLFLLAEPKLRSSLPKFMIPNVFIPLNRIPLTPSGKANRRTLREWASGVTRNDLESYTTITAPKQSPVTATEITLHRIWACLLFLDPESIGINDNFFKLGGDSIKAMQFTTVCRKEGINVTVQDVFQEKTIANLSLCVSVAKSHPVEVGPGSATIKDLDGIEVHKGSPVEIQPFSLIGDLALETVVQAAIEQCHTPRDEIEDIYPTTALQEALIASTVKRDGMYTADFTFLLHENVSEERFKAAWQATVFANPILRTRIIHIESLGSFQVVIRCNNINWNTSQSLDSYLAINSHSAMGLGKALARFGLVSSSFTSQPSSFVLTLHHSIYDGASLPIIFRQVEEAYRDITLQQQLFSPFIDYLLRTAGSADFWRSQFVNCHAAVFPSLPSATYMPTSDSFIEYQMKNILIMNTDHTLSTYMRLAWALIMSHYTESEDVVFGQTVSGRAAGLAGIENMTGPTIATVPFRITFNQKEIVRDTLSNVQSRYAKMIPFEHAGLQHIRKLSNKTAAACDFQSYIIIQSPHESLGQSIMEEVKSLWTDYNMFSSYALVLFCNPTPNNQSYNLRVNFDPVVIGKDEVQRLVQQFDYVLQQLPEKIDQRIQDVQFCSPQDIQQLGIWNPPLPVARDNSLHELVMRHCISQPNTLAVSSWDGDLTYGELDNLSSYLAQHLMELGILREEVVPLCFDKSKYAIVTIVSVLRAGGACLCISPDLPRDRRLGIIEETAARFVLCSASNNELIRHKGTTVVTVSANMFSLLQPSASFIPPHVASHSLAFVLYTSGSTGKPKGILLEHVNICTSIESYKESMDVTPKTKLLHFASYAFDMSIYEIFTALTCGACLSVPHDFDRMNNLGGYIHQHQITLAMLTPTTVSVLRPETLPHLKTLVLAGEAITQDNVNTWAGKVDLVDAYGPAETTICAVGRIPERGWIPDTIGHVVGGRGWIATTENPQKLAAIGAVGQLIMEGPVVARGYLNQQEKTEELFIEHPPWLKIFHPIDKKKLYLTGDLMRYNSDGSIRYMGRRDHQIKLRGQRIELQEIEYQVRQALNGAVQVVAEIVVPQEADQSPFLVAFLHIEQESNADSDIILSPNTELSGSKLATITSQLSKTLPSYMIPAVFIPVSRIPLGATGKLDRKRLRNLVATMSSVEIQVYRSSSGEKRMPTSEMKTEILLQQLWAKILHIPLSSIGLDDNYIHIGGDSISSMRLAAAARREGLELSVGDIFSHTLSELAMNSQRPVQTNNILRDQRPCRSLGIADPERFIREDIVPRIPLENFSVVDVLPTTEYQRIFIEYQQCTFVVIDIPRPVDESRLSKATQAVVEKYAILQTVFLPYQDTLVQAIIQQNHRYFLVHRVAQDPMSISTSICEENNMIPYGTPSFQLKLISQGGSRNALVLRISHALYDGLSIPKLFHDLSAAYEGKSIGTVLTTYPIYMQYRLSQQTATAYEFWRNFLHNASMTYLDRDILGGDKEAAHETEVCAQRDIQLPVPPPGITMSTLFKAAWSFILAKTTQNYDLVFAQVVSGRNISMEGVEDVYGACINYAPVRVTIEASSTAIDLMRHVAEQHARTILFEALDLQHIVANCTAWNKGTDFGCLVHYRDMSMPTQVSLDDHVCVATPLSFYPVKKYFTVTASPVDNSLEICVEASSRIIGVESAGQIAKDICDAILRFAAEPNDILSFH